MYREELSQIAQTVWESAVRLELMPPAEGASERDPPTLTAVVSFTGAWSGHVTLTLGESLSRRIAGSMLELDPGRLVKEDVLDALREVINMLGGNIKALLPPPCQLSLPFVIAAGTGGVSFGGRPIEEAVQFECEQQTVEIVLHAGPGASGCAPGRFQPSLQ